jgi:type I restriction enzyme, S subunit
VSMTSRRLGEAVHYLRGITFKPEEKVDPNASDAVVCMRTKNVQDILDATDLIAVPSSLVRRDDLYLREGDILLSSANSWNLVGKVCRVPKLNYRATAGGFISVVRPRPGVDSRYLYHWLASPPVQERIRACSRQTTNISNLSVSQFEQLQIPLPMPEEQRRIADILDKADTIRRKRKQAIAFTEELLRSAFLDMFGDPVTNPKGWSIASVADLCETKQYGTAEKANSEGRGIPVLRMNNLTYAGEVDITDLKWVELSTLDAAKLDLREGDVLFNRVNSLELVGKTAAWHGGDGFTFAGYLIRLRMLPEVATGDYIAAAMNMPSMKKRLMAMAKPSINMANISGSDLTRLILPVPPLPLQKRYDTLSSRVRRLRVHYSGASDCAGDLFSSLVAHAFSGSVDQEAAC